ASHPTLSPLFFFAALGATAVAGGLSIASGVDTANRHASFDRCLASAQSCAALSSSGQSAQTRTNVLLGVTAGLGVATLVTLVFVRWHDASLSVGSNRVSFDARF
ncbi:MAG TPA: hypothetical protein VGL81_33100, partial [Polyangiaceae bacterium]